MMGHSTQDLVNKKSTTIKNRRRNRRRRRARANACKSGKKKTLKSNDLERAAIYTVDQVLSKAVHPLTNKKKSRRDFDGDMVPMNSQRYELFKEKGIKCVACGVEGKYFAKERHRTSKGYHFNLYAVDDKGREVLMTKDHIIPKSKGGENKLHNYQTMCYNCNIAKGAKILNWLALQNAWGRCLLPLILIN